MDSPLLDREVFDVEFSDLHLAHTAVKHKPPRPEFAKTFQVKVCGLALLGFRKRDKWDTEVRWLLASFRREVGRRPFNTAGSDWTAANMEQHLHERVSCFQFAHWLSGSDLLQVFGALRSAGLSGGASWATLALFLVLVLFELGSLHVVGGNQSRCVCKLITGVVAVDLLNLLVCFDLLP